MKILILGYGGIAKALCQVLLPRGKVTVISRQSDLPSPITAIQANVIEAQSLDTILDKIENPVDLVINTLGFLHDDSWAPEKNLASCDPKHLMHAININTLPTMKLCQALQKHMPANSATKVICFSARVSSISDNRLGGWHSYRMSKCALNMLIKNIALEWSRSFKHAVICGYHPGTVATPLSAPFQANVKPEKLFTPEQAADYCLAVIDQITPKHSGQLLDWQGQIIAT